MAGDPHCRAATAPQGLQTTWPFCVELGTMILKVYGSKKHPEKPSQQSCTGAGRVLVSAHQNTGDLQCAHRCSQARDRRSRNQPRHLRTRDFRQRRRHNAMGNHFRKRRRSNLVITYKKARFETYLRPHIEINLNKTVSPSIEAKLGKVLEKTQENTYLPQGMTKIV